MCYRPTSCLQLYASLYAYSQIALVPWQVQAVIRQETVLNTPMHPQLYQVEPSCVEVILSAHVAHKLHISKTDIELSDEYEVLTCELL